MYSIEEGLALRSALPPDPDVGHSFAVDGSITFTHGPVFPACPTLGLKGCEDGELLDEPWAVWEAARWATACAAVLAHEVEVGRART